MRWLIVNTDYDEFLRALYADNPGLADEPYERQMQVRIATRFGTADFYSHHLRALGHEALDVFPNNEILQRRWATEHGVRSRPAWRWRLRLRRRCVPWPHRARDRRWLYEILAAQVRAWRPDVFYCMAIETIGSDFLRAVRGSYRLAVLQHAAVLPATDIRAYDLALSSLPNLVAHFRGQGLPAEYFRLGFEPRVLGDLDGAERAYDVVFVGGLAGVHDPGARVLEALCEHCDVHVWGYSADRLPPGSRLRQRCQGPLFGRAMFRALRRARIVFNRHSQVAGPYANNMRLYEATGVGTLLLTDRKANLDTLFAPGREVAAYGSPQECIALARHYLAHPAEREALAAAGQARTLREHTYARRMEELVEIVRRHL